MTIRLTEHKIYSLLGWGTDRAMKVCSHCFQGTTKTMNVLKIANVHIIFWDFVGIYFFGQTDNLRFEVSYGIFMAFRAQIINSYSPFTTLEHQKNG